MRNCSRFIFLGFLCKASPYYRKWTNAGRSRDNLFRFRRSRHLSHSPESSAECVEQQSSGESARTKQVQHCEDPGKPLKNHGCEPNRRPYQAGDHLCRAPFCFDYGRGDRRRSICGFRSAGGVNTQSCIHVGGPVSSFVLLRHLTLFMTRCCRHYPTEYFLMTLWGNERVTSRWRA